MHLHTHVDASLWIREVCRALAQQDIQKSGNVLASSAEKMRKALLQAPFGYQMRPKSVQMEAGGPRTDAIREQKVPQGVAKGAQGRPQGAQGTPKMAKSFHARNRGGSGMKKSGQNDTKKL